MSFRQIESVRDVKIGVDDFGVRYASYLMPNDDIVEWRGVIPTYLVEKMKKKMKKENENNNK